MKTIRLPSILLPDPVPQHLQDGLIETAKALSSITGLDIRWYYVRDGCSAVYGEYGWFVIVGDAQESHSYEQSRHQGSRP